LIAVLTFVLTFSQLHNIKLDQTFSRAKAPPAKTGGSNSGDENKIFVVKYQRNNFEQERSRYLPETLLLKATSVLFFSLFYYYYLRLQDVKEHVKNVLQ